MQKIFLQQQISTLDKLTVERQNITSLQLMERAAKTVADFVMSRFDRCRVAIMAGPGNNGGDGLVVARMLSIVGFDVTVYSFTGRSGNRSDDCEANFKKLPPSVAKHVNFIEPSLEDYPIIVDALLGTGLSRKVEGIIAEAIDRINSSDTTIISIDLPSGMGCEETLTCLDDMPIVKADFTIGFQQPKLAFMMPEAHQYVGEWTVTDIGIDSTAIAENSTDMFLIEQSDIASMIKCRNRFAHKGSIGRSIIFAGSRGMMGAAQLSAKACLRGGTGLLTMAIPSVGYEIMQIGVPEAMAVTIGDDFITSNSFEPSRLPKTDAVGIGPGLGRNHSTQDIINDVLALRKPTVIDADALWHLAKIRNNGSPKLDMAILTPHEGEFDNLTCPHNSRYDRLLTARRFAVDNKTTLILKGAFTAICLCDGRIVFNPTGNAGMATGGSGDVLTGILTALLAQGYSTEESAIIGVYLHGLAGDIAEQHTTDIALIASDIIKYLPEAWQRVKTKH
ncbi:MAG: NAD(P)H-hydrate dehydratase [Bacteroidales bacterium]|nr:NAD(P)H-hydrate dehydratase [Bacteroidales bacterium]